MMVPGLEVVEEAGDEKVEDVETERWSESALTNAWSELIYFFA